MAVPTWAAWREGRTEDGDTGTSVVLGAIAPGIIKPPTSSDGNNWWLIKGKSGQVQAQVLDTDYWDGPAPPPCGCYGDPVTYHWSVDPAVAGTFSSVTAAAPTFTAASDFTGPAVLSVYASDSGTKNDDADSLVATRAFRVVELEKLIVFWRGGGAYPFDTDGIDFRALMYVKGSEDYEYCGMETSGEWYKVAHPDTGTPSAEDPEAPASLERSAPPTGKGQESMGVQNWNFLLHDRSDPDDDHNRAYWHTREGSHSVGGWGANGITLDVGTRNARAYCQLQDSWANGTAKVSKYNPSDPAMDGQGARLSIRTTEYNGHDLTSMLQMAFAYLHVSYEWGGYGFGGKSTANQQTKSGGSIGYDLYGTDCSGFVSAVHWRAAAGWSPWKKTTYGIAADCEPIADHEDADYTRYDLAEVGDMLNKTESHVRLIYAITGTGENRRFFYIEASGDPLVDGGGRVRTGNCTAPEAKAAGYHVVRG